MTQTAMIVHAAADSAAAEALAAFLGTGTRVVVSTNDGLIPEGTPLLHTIERAFSADVTVVLLSAAAVAVRASGGEWEEVFENAPDARVTSVSLDACAVPALLRRRRIFDASDDRLPAFRALKRWMLDAKAVSLPPAGDTPVSPLQLDQLRAAIADQPGTARLPADSPLWAAFVNGFHADFEAVVWLDAAGRSPVNLLSEVGDRLGVRMDGPAAADTAAITTALASPRLLVAVANLDDPARLPPLGPLCSLLTTEPADAAGSGPGAILAVMRQWHMDTSTALAALPAAEAIFADPETEWATAVEIARLSFLLCRRRGRVAEAEAWADRLARAAIAHHDREVAIEAERELSWIREQWHARVAAPVIEAAPAEQLSLF